MALTKVSQALGSTPSIDDNGTATALTIDSSQNSTFANDVIHSAYTKYPANTASVLTTGGDSAIFGGTSAFPSGVNGNLVLQTRPTAGAAIYAYTGATPTLAMTIDSVGQLTSSVAGGYFETRADGGGFKYKQNLDVATAGATFTGESNRGELASISLYQTTTSADGGYIVLRTSPSGSTTPAERVRIDSSGKLLVGTTSFNPGVVGFGAAPNGDVYMTRSESTNSYVTNQVYSTGAAAYRFYVGMAGTVYATSTSISAISDQTLKTNIRDLETGLTEVMALKPRRFDWKNGDAKNVAGFVAQEIEQVLPELVSDYKYSDTETKKSLKMGDILPTLVKAIQEQQATIESQAAAITDLTTRLTALENN